MSVRVFSSSKILSIASGDSELLEFEDKGVGTSADLVTVAVVDAVDFEVKSGENAVLDDDAALVDETGGIEVAALVVDAIVELATEETLGETELVVDAFVELATEETLGETVLVFDAFVELATTGDRGTVVVLEETAEAETEVGETVDDMPDNGDWLD